jgi:hypothetical protein
MKLGFKARFFHPLAGERGASERRRMELRGAARGGRCRGCGAAGGVGRLRAGGRAGGRENSIDPTK